MMDPACATVLAVHVLGIAVGFARMLPSKSTIAPLALWPLGVTAFYSSYTSGYSPAADGSLEVAATCLYVTPRRGSGAGGDAAAAAPEVLWRPPTDAHFSRRVNSENKLAGGGGAGASRANLVLLALAEDPRVADATADGEEETAAGAAEATAARGVCAKYARVRWLQRRVTFTASGACDEVVSECLRLEGEELRRAVVEALSHAKRGE